MNDTPVKNPYGFCPICGAPGHSRERRPGGNDTCLRNHTYPSKDAIPVSADVHPLRGGNHMIDMRECKSVDLTVDPNGKIWVNVNGICVFRSGHTADVVVEINYNTPNGTREHSRIEKSYPQ